MQLQQDEIIEMARQAGIDHHKLWNDDGTNNLEAFAKLVAAAAASKEREACALMCEDNATDLSEGDWDSACFNCADHIRARGEA